ncbi:MAG: pirin family protein [Planctomycetes bacterium]|nr:pirin family protein [Planctomycetota bacterium]
MIRKRPSQERGHADHGWLNAYHTFSFADYYDPKHMGFGVLRVINQDRIQPSRGFATHGHDNMEIITYVISGVLEHKDSMGNGSQIRPGDVQVMSAGTGVTHSEFNPLDDSETHLLQMWVLPAERGTEPRWDQAEFPLEQRRGRMQRVVSPTGADGSLTVGQDVTLWAGLLDAGDVATAELAPGRRAWLHVARGSLVLNGVEFGPGDGAAIEQETGLRLEGRSGAEFVWFDLP